MGEQALRAVQIKANLRERNIDGTQIIAKQDRAPDDATGMIEVLSQQLRNLYRAETHKYCEQLRADISRAAEDEEGPSNALPC